MSKRQAPRTENLRKALAQEAARVMSEHGIRDFLFAKRKAAERLGVAEDGTLPRNAEIEAALAEYQRLFGGEEHDESLRAQREAARTAMQLLKDFAPRLVGAVLSGTATEHSDVQLHVFADGVETITFFLMDRRIPHEVDEKRVRMNPSRVLLLPTIWLEIENQPIEVIVFSPDGVRQSPVSLVDGKPMRRADLAEVEKLLATQDSETRTQS